MPLEEDLSIQFHKFIQTDIRNRLDRIHGWDRVLQVSSNLLTFILSGTMGELKAYDIPGQPHPGGQDPICLGTVAREPPAGG
jgi:hypothetical protein